MKSGGGQIRGILYRSVGSVTRTVVCSTKATRLDFKHRMTFDVHAHQLSIAEKSTTFNTCTVKVTDISQKHQ